jgi:3-oxoacyl-[acyl-carrier-protein] synthase-3
MPQLSSAAIKNLFTETNDWAEVELLAAGTTSPDQLLPSHAAMVHGELNHNPLEIHSVTGACCAGDSST